MEGGGGGDYVTTRGQFGQKSTQELTSENQGNLSLAADRLVSDIDACFCYDTVCAFSEFRPAHDRAGADPGRAAHITLRKAETSLR